MKSFCDTACPLLEIEMLALFDNIAKITDASQKSILGKVTE